MGGSGSLLKLGPTEYNGAGLDITMLKLSGRRCQSKGKHSRGQLRHPQ